MVDSVLGSQTASGPGWHRYGVKAGQLGQPAGSTDGYGDCYVPDPTSCSPTGAPWFPSGTGSGHPWPLLGGERAEQDLQTGQVLDQPAITRARYVSGHAPATVPLTISVTAPGAVATAPSTSTAPPGMTEDILASQEPGLVTQRARATVSGKTAPGAAVDIAVSQPGIAGNTTVIVRTVAGSDGSFRAVVPTPVGQTILTVSVTAGSHATGWAQQTVTGK